VLNEMNNILIVDDNPLLLNVLSEILKLHGYNVRTAAEGFEALAAIRDRAPDILLSDLNMPGMSGFELLSVVRRRFPNIVVIAMSGEYAGAVVPPGVAADGFYAKGSKSSTRLFEILSTIHDEEVRRSARGRAPVWLSTLPISQDDYSRLTIACPECLRVFSYSVRGAAFDLHESCCPHCLCPVQLAIAKHSDRVDRTGLSLSSLADMSSRPTFAVYQNSQCPAGSLSR